MYSVAYAKISTNAVATFQIAGTVQNIFTVAQLLDLLMLVLY